MKDAYSFHPSKECLGEFYEQMYGAYEKVFDRAGLKYRAVEADAGNMASGDQRTHEFQVLADTGEDTIIYDASGKSEYAANIEKAQTIRQGLQFRLTEDTVEPVDTPGKATIEDVCAFLDCPQHHSLKSLVYVGIKGEEETVVLLQLLGDDQLSEVKLKNYLGVDHIAPATDGKLKELDLPVGFIGPVGLKNELRVIIDSTVDPEAAYVSGALEVDKHLKNVVPNRDFPGFEQVDLRLAQEGDYTLEGHGPVKECRGIEVGHVFELGNKYTQSMKIGVLDENGKNIFPLMGCYGIGITRTVAAAIEQHHDEKGIIWPKSIAPYHVYFALIAKTDEYKALGEEIYQDLLKEGIEIVFDDRKAGAGFKFKDADLLGLPLRLVLGERDHKEKGTFEIVERRSGEKHEVKREEIVSKLRELLKGQI